MPYAEGRIYNDADSHLMETANWLPTYADPRIRDRLAPLDLDTAGGLAQSALDVIAGKPRDPSQIPALEANLMNTKGWLALGAADSAERTRALDLLGFNRQLVFSSVGISQFWGLFDRRRPFDPDLYYGGARAHNRAIADFCARDKRLLAVGFVPLDVPELAEKEVDEAIRLGCKAIQVPAEPPRDLSPTHPALNGVWSRLQDAGVPFVLHVGSNGSPMPRVYTKNDRPVTADHVGGEGGEHLSSKDIMATHQPAEMFLTAMVLDGIFEQFPRLRGGCIEQGALWVVTWLKRLDMIQETFVRYEPRLAMPMKASDYVRRQLKFTPYPIEPVGWMIEQAGKELFLFSSDYPHPEGGRNPIRRFESSLQGITDDARDDFYARNFDEMMGVGGTA
jgi:uncharacterized protein